MSYLVWETNEWKRVWARPPTSNPPNYLDKGVKTLFFFKEVDCCFELLNYPRASNFSTTFDNRIGEYEDGGLQRRESTRDGDDSEYPLFTLFGKWWMR